MNDGLPYTDLKGMKAGNCKTSEEEIRRVCLALQDRPTVSAGVIARIHRLTVGKVEALVKGRTWTHVTEDYDFTERHKFNMKWGPKNRRPNTDNNPVVKKP